jgi:hypothetical protein
MQAWLICKFIYLRARVCTNIHQEYGKVPHYLLKRKEEMVTRQQKVHERLKHHPTDCPPVFVIVCVRV